MPDFDKTNRGQIWPNDKKGIETRPDFQGSLNVNGQEFWVSAWKRKEGANPKSPSLTFSIQEKDRMPDKEPKDYPEKKEADNFEYDSIPF